MGNVRSGLVLYNEIGKGFFGTVYRGVDPVHGEVAVKVIDRKPSDTDQQWDAYKASFLAEAQNLSKATHPNVVQVHYIGEAENSESIHICMAFCHGGSLQKHYDVGPISIDYVRKAGTDVLMGLGALHARGMLHRDIKPGNILIDKLGVARLGDFGLVTDDLILGYGSQAGYYDHIAYEVWGGRGTSVRSDLWAFGMTLYRLLHGKAWYEEAPRPAEVIELGNYSSSLKWLPHVPHSWRRVIRKLMNDDPAKRYGTADQALNALSKLSVIDPWKVTCSNSKIRWEMVSVRPDRPCCAL